MYIDAHLHIYDLAKYYNFEKTKLEQLTKTLQENYFCTNSQSLQEFEYTKDFCKKHRLKAFYSFGIHPQNPVTDALEYLEKLLAENQVDVIGEIGFDLFDKYYKSTFAEQQKVWDTQISLAKKYDLPILLHLRKATHMIFKNKQKLKQLPSVIFHGWSGSTVEASSILKAGINGFFSLGKGILRGQKSSIAMAKSFSLERLLSETDAPYMELKNQNLSSPSDIKAVTKKIAELRFSEYNPKNKNLTTELFLTEKVLPQIKKNFLQAVQAMQAQL